MASAVEELIDALDVEIPGLNGADIPEPPPIDKATIERLDVANPSAVVETMGLIFDAFAEAQHGHAHAAKAVKYWKGQVNATTAALTRRAVGKDAEARKQWVQELVHQSKQWANLQISEAKLAEYDVSYDYLSKQGSLLQSILKRFESEAWEGRFGKAASR